MSDKSHEVQHEEYAISIPIVKPPIPEDPNVNQKVTDAVEHYKSIRAFKNWRKSIVIDPAVMGGQPVFPGTRITVRRIAALKNRGESTKIILEDYPCLTEQDIEFAQRYYSIQDI